MALGASANNAAEVANVTNLKIRRLRVNETQAQAAARVGISIALFREIEAGPAIPSVRVAMLLEKAFQAAAARLLRRVAEA